MHNHTCVAVATRVNAGERTDWMSWYAAATMRADACSTSGFLLATSDSGVTGGFSEGKSTPFDVTEASMELMAFWMMLPRAFSSASPLDVLSRWACQAVSLEGIQDAHLFDIVRCTG